MAVPRDHPRSRHRKFLRSNLGDIGRSAICRLADYAGVSALECPIFEETRNSMYEYLLNLVRASMTYTEHSRRRMEFKDSKKEKREIEHMTTVMDVVFALKFTSHKETVHTF